MLFLLHLPSAPSENAVSPGHSSDLDPKLSTRATLVPQPATPSNSESLDAPSSAPRQRMQLTPWKKKLYQRFNFLSASKSELVKTNRDLKKKLKNLKWP